MGGGLLDGVDAGLDPAEAVLLHLLVEAGAEAGEPSVAATHDDVLQVVVARAFVRELEGLDDGASHALLLQPDVLRGEEDLGNLEALLVERDVLRVDGRCVEVLCFCCR